LLLRDSQYLTEDVSEAQINAVVSGALDRLHSERDPCVRFDNDQKLWIYLHRDLTPTDFKSNGNKEKAIENKTETAVTN